MAFLGLVSRKEHERVARELAAIKAGRETYEPWQLNTAGAEKFNMPDPSVYGNQADLYRKLSWVMLAVDLTASAGALTPFEVKRLIEDREPKDLPGHAFEKLLQRPNDLDSRYEFLYATIAFFKLTGNAYWWLNRESENAPPDEMWLIPSNMIIPVPDEKLYLRGYRYFPGNGKEIFLKPHEITHFKRFNPASRFVGLSVIESIAMTAQGQLAMEKYNTELFAVNNGRLPGILAFKEMVENSTWSKIKEDTREAAKNRDYLMLRGAGDGVNWLQNSITNREMEFLAGMAANKENIMTAIAPGSFTMLSENSTQANSVVGRASFNELTVYPMHVMMGEKITTSILTSYSGRELIGCFEDIRVADKDQEFKEQELYQQTHTVDEIRTEKYGDEPIGDERGKMLVSQINSATGKPEQPSYNPVNNVKPDESLNQPEPDTQPAANDANKAMQEDMARWQRKAMKKIGSFVPFDSAVIPMSVRAHIEGNLPACKTEADVRRVFSTNGGSDAAAVIEGIRLALKGG